VIKSGLTSRSQASVT